MNQNTLFRLAASGKLPERAVFMASLVAMGVIFVANLAVDPALRLYLLYLLPLLAIGMYSSRRVFFLAGVGAVLLFEAITFAYRDVDAQALVGNLLLEAVVAALCLSVADTARVSYLKMLNLARTDELTGLLNRRAFVRTADVEIERQARYGGEFSILMLDLDGFKTLTDTHGHFAGDIALRHLAEAIRASVRRPDSVARIGGDEFVVLMPNTPKAACDAICQQLRRAVADAMRDSGFTITASIGGVTFEHPPESVDMALRAADASMSQAKQNGGDCVVCV